MMANGFGNCPMCNKYDYLPMHTCGDLFSVWDEDWDREDAQEIYAIDVEEAAKKFFEVNLSDFEYLTSINCYVDDLEGKIHKFKVEVEMQPSFLAQCLSFETYDQEDKE
jgi:hypothetical protein